MTKERGWINILGMMVVRAIGFSSYASETTVYSLRCVEVKETHLLPGGRAPENTRARVPPPCVCVCACVRGGGGVCVYVCVCVRCGVTFFDKLLSHSRTIQRTPPTAPPRPPLRECLRLNACNCKSLHACMQPPRLMETAHSSQASRGLRALRRTRVRRHQLCV